MNIQESIDKILDKHMDTIIEVMRREIASAVNEGMSEVVNELSQPRRGNEHV
jgi:hypothetical protein